MCVRRPKNPSQLRDVFRLFQLHIGVSEMQFDTAPQSWILRAPRELPQRVILERVEPAKSNEPTRILRRLLGVPIVLGSDRAYSSAKLRDGLP